MSRKPFLLAALLLAAGLTASAGIGRQERPRNVVLIGWDGAQRNHVKECLGRGELPNLARLGAEGALVAIDVLRITDTKAGWAQILTGYNPETTGVYSNSRYQPIPQGLTIFERLEAHFGRENIVTVAVIGKKGNVDADAPEKIEIKPRNEARIRERLKKNGGRIAEEGGTRYYVVPGKPYYNAKNAMDLFENGLQKDETVGVKALGYLEKYADRPFFFFIHFAEADHAGHAHGENSKEYNDALISADHWTGRIVDKLKELGLYERTVVYVTADHGFDEGMTSHADAPYVFLGTNDRGVVRRGERADIAPTILERLGLDLGKLEPPLDGRPLTRDYGQAEW